METSETERVAGVEERYLDLLKGCLTRHLFLDEEVEDVVGAGWKGTAFAPVRRALNRRGLRLVRTGGNEHDRSLGLTWPRCAETMVGLRRLDNVQACVTDVVRREVPGDLIETGVWRGGTTILMRAVLAAFGDTERRVWVADSFQGLPTPDLVKYPADGVDPFEPEVGGVTSEHAVLTETLPVAPARKPFAEKGGRPPGWGGLGRLARSRRRGPAPGYEPWNTPQTTLDRLVVSMDEVKANFARYGLLDSQVEFLAGWFKDTLPSAPIDQLAVIRLDGDLYESTMDALCALYPKLSVGGWLIVDDYNCIDACRLAVTDYRAQHGLTEEIERVDWTAVCWQRRH